MPIFYKYILTQFYKYFFLAITCSMLGAFITKLSKLSGLLVFSPSLSHLFKFFLHYMHQLTPYCIAIACFIANFSTLKQFYNNALLQALYACTIPYKKIITPLFINTFLWFLLALYSTCVLSPKVQLKINEKLLKKTTFNPILALQSGNLLQNIPHASLGSVINNNSQITDFCLLTRPFVSKPPVALTADQVLCRDHTMQLTKVSLTIPDSPLTTNYQNLKSNHQYQFLELPVHEAINAMAKKTNTNLINCIPVKHLIKSRNLKSSIEIAYRLALTLFTLSITFLLFIYYKNPSKKSSIIIGFLGLLLALSFFSAKGLSNSVGIPYLYLSIHIVILFSHLFSHKKRGYIENTL
jgi:lipopolysaccharide export LptBFGC system permease protein LptF